jgi:hypothetical protein
MRETLHVPSSIQPDETRGSEWQVQLYSISVTCSALDNRLISGQVSRDISPTGTGDMHIHILVHAGNQTLLMPPPRIPPVTTTRVFDEQTTKSVSASELAILLAGAKELAPEGQLLRLAAAGPADV